MAWIDDLRSCEPPATVHIPQGTYILSSMDLSQGDDLLDLPETRQPPPQESGGKG